MSSYNLGMKVMKRMVEDANAYSFFKAKFGVHLFKGAAEVELYTAIAVHFTKYQQLPKPETLLAKFPDFAEVDAPEPSAFYIDQLENRFIYDTINKANVASQGVLQANKADVQKAIDVLDAALGAITSQRYRSKILDMGTEGSKLLVGTYHNTLISASPAAAFGWPYMDNMSGGCLPGDVVSFVGRPAMGKTWFLLYVALYNWVAKHMNVVFVSMEMNTLAIAQRLGAMYAGTNISQLKIAGYSSSTMGIFMKGLSKMDQEPSKFYVVDGNMAASVEDMYALTSQLGGQVLLLDGAYLARHKNPRLDRFTRVAENVELMKRYGTDMEIPTFASWQFNREASKKVIMKGGKAGLEDIGFSDAIGQISSIVCGLMQEEGVETMQKRSVDVLKGRNGEIGQFAVNWLFSTMNFQQVGEQSEQTAPKLLQFV